MMDSTAKNRAATDNESWDIVIEPRRRYISLDLASVWRYRDLAWMFFKRDFIAIYKQTILGPLWYLIQPLLTAITYLVVFSRIANIPTAGLPPFVFYMSGIVMWTFFAACLTNNADLFSKNAALFGKVYFPRLVVPIAIVMSGMVAFAIQFVLLLTIVLVYWLSSPDVQINWLGVLMVPALVLYVGSLGMGVGLVVSAMTVRFRDLVFAVGFVTQLWMFASPVVYPYSQIPERIRGYLDFNPMTAPIESLRALMFGTGGVDSSVWLINLCVTLFLLALGLVLFTRAETRAMDTV
jgi:lipopolysaccharide transport system permease protein